MRHNRSTAQDRSRKQLWKWSAPPGWPSPPRDWVPWSGWQPGASWPTPPPDHKYWRRTRRWYAGRVVILGVPIVLVLGFFGSCAVVLDKLGPCGFDPAPGDYGLMPVVNDTAAAVSLFSCSDDSCDRGYNIDAVQAGHRLRVQYEMCNGDQIGITNASGLLIGCLTFPIGEPPKVDRLLVSDRAQCSTSTGVHPSISAP